MKQARCHLISFGKVLKREVVLLNDPPCGEAATKAEYLEVKIAHKNAIPMCSAGRTYDTRQRRRQVGC